MKPGLYEQLITLGVAEHLAAHGLQDERDDAGEMAAQVLARHVFDLLFKAHRLTTSSLAPSRA